MPSLCDAVPTPEQLGIWLGVASPRTARGRSLWTPAEETWSTRYTFAARRPVVVSCPARVEVSFAHAAPDRWRVDTPDGPLARYDGDVAVVWSDRGVETGGALLVFHGPVDLLHPEHRERAGGTVVEDELLGRRCWRWQAPGSTVWVDEATGCALRTDRRDGRLELTSFEIDVALEDEVFSVPAEVLAAALPVEKPRRRSTAVPDDRPAPTAPFRVPWWPGGVSGHPVDGDPDVPELLLELHSDGRPSSPRMWLGIAPAGHRPRVRDGADSRTWDGDGWSFALSWQGDVADAELDRVIASTPRTWSPGGRS